MESIQLSSPLASSRATASSRPSPTDTSRQNEDFDRQLNRQMEQADAAKAPAHEPAKAVKKPENTEENQQTDEDVKAAAETEDAPVDDVSADTESGEKAEADGEQAGQPVLDLAIEVDAETELNGVDDTQDGDTIPAVALQNLPPDGNDLPPEANADPAVPVAEVAAPVVAETPVVNVQTVVAETAMSATKTAAVTTPASQQVAATPVSQLAAESAQTLGSGENFAPELKLQTRGGDGEKPTTPVARNAMMQMASAASFASSMQQVHQASAAANLHLNNPGLSSADNGLATQFNNSLPTAINTPLQHPAWSQGVADRVAWMVQGNLQSAQIKLNPANLGPMEIKLSLHDDHRTSITFVSAHAPVRDALDAAMPRLRDMLESQGMNLVDVNVADAGVHSQQQSADQGSASSSSGLFGDAADNGIESSSGEVMVSVPTADGLSIYA